MSKQLAFQSITAVVIALAATLAAPSAQATLLVDRGLPKTNLNNAAGADRSNVSWSIDDQTGFTGDDFTVGVAGETYLVDSITVWGAQVNPLEKDLNNIWLYLGKAGSVLTMVSTGAVTGNTNSNVNITHSYVTYADNLTSIYQGWGGGTYGIAQTTFSGLNFLVEGGVKYNFGVDGDLYQWWSHASNAALSGTPQQGSDGKYLVFKTSDLNSAEVVDSNGTGWDKSSDINVRVNGSQVPEPASLALMGLAIAGLAVSRRRKPV